MGETVNEIYGIAAVERRGEASVSTDRSRFATRILELTGSRLLIRKALKPESMQNKRSSELDEGTCMARARVRVYT